MYSGFFVILTACNGQQVQAIFTQFYLFEKVTGMYGKTLDQNIKFMQLKSISLQLLSLMP